jgi:2-dehydro-3-deoxygalactonokinase
VGEHEVAIVPGLRCTNPRGAPDVLRGEETQVLGVLAQYPELARGRQILGLPGTHTKWVLTDEGRIIHFHTGFSGELFAVLRDHSTLCRVSSNAGAIRDERDAFLRGARRAIELRATPLSHLLFEVRSRQLVEGQSSAQALAFLSGLLIGQDVLGVLGIFGGLPERAQRVSLVGSADLTALYQVVLEALDMQAFCLDAEAATVNGLRAVAHAN